MTVNNAADGTGTNTVTPLTTLAGTATTETFTYTAPTGGMTNGAVTIDVPAGWTAPQLAAGAGQVTSDVGTAAVAGQTVTVSEAVTRNAGQTVTITYAGGIATTTTGAVNWTTKQKSTAGRHADEHRRATVRHRQQRSGRNRHADVRHAERPRLLDRQHDHLHLHRPDRRHDQRRRHRRRACRLDRTADRCGRRAGDLPAPARCPSPARRSPSAA